jgi:SAM-dependent methyltransferase
MQERHTNKQAYFQEQVYTTKEFVIPFIEACLPLGSRTKVLEVGCGEGGNLVPFLDRGCHVTGIDLSATKIELAGEFLKVHPGTAKLVLVAKDVYDAAEDLDGGFDLIIMRDVIEHIHDQDRYMGYIRNFLKPEGMFFLAFPPWYNPFGGHQQISRNRILSKLPYYHLLPPWLYRFILKTGGENDQTIYNLLEIKETGISIERFRRLIKKHDYRIVKEMFFFINPNYKIKFGLKPREQSSFVGAIPFIRNLFTTSAYYIISKP